MQSVQSQPPAAEIYKLPPVPWKYKNIWLFLRARGARRLKLYEQLTRDKGPVAQISADGKTPTIMLKHPESIAHIFRDKDGIYSKPPVDFLHLILGEGQLFANGELWEKEMKLSRRAFTGPNHEKMAATMVQVTKDAVKRWEDTYKGKPVKISEEMPDIALRVLIGSLFNLEKFEHTAKIQSALGTLLDVVSARLITPPNMKMPEEELAAKSPYREAISDLFGVASEMITTRRIDLLENYDFSSKEHIYLESEAYLSSVAPNGEDLIQEQLRLLPLALSTGREPTQQQLELLRNSSFSHKDDLLSVLAVEGDLTRKQREQQVLTFTLAGHETTAHAMTFGLKLLTEHPQVWKKIREEVDSVLGGEPATAKTYQKLTYTTAVFKEILRLYPSVAAVIRKADKDDKIPLGNGLVLPVRAGQTVFASASAAHLNPEFWQKPLEFWPERHLAENKKNIIHGSYFPFALGQRHCIGEHFALMEGVLVLATLAQSCDVSVIKPKRVKAYPAVTLRPKKPVWAYVTRRKTAMPREMAL